MLPNVKKGEINPRLIYPISRLVTIKYSGHGTALVLTMSLHTNIM